MVKKVLVAVANGVEDIEAISVVDVLRRAGAEVVIASVQKLQITTAHGIKLIADKLVSDCMADDFDLIVVPGGLPGAEYLRDSKELITLLKKQKTAGKWFAAICASPVMVLQHHGLLDGVKATCYPALLMQLKTKDAALQKVVVDGNCVTSQGPGTAMLFAVKLVELLFGKEKADALARSLLI